MSQKRTRKGFGKLTALIVLAGILVPLLATAALAARKQPRRHTRATTRRTAVSPATATPAPVDLDVSAPVVEPTGPASDVSPAPAAPTAAQTRPVAALRPIRTAAPNPRPATAAPAAAPAAATPQAVAVQAAPAPADPAPTASGDFEGYDLGSWADGTRHGGWLNVFSGFGSVGVVTDASKVLNESPKVSTSAGETHASLVASTTSYGDMDLRLRMKTVRQLRQGSAPNSWEVAWALWHYTDNTHFYYVILKPDGWEIGKEDPAYPGAQRFLATGERGFSVGAWHTVGVRQVGSTFTVSADGSELATFTDNERPYASGAVGLYNEDAEVHFDDVTIAQA
jgi:hypothetical protein